MHDCHINGQNILRKMVHINTVVDALLDISGILFETIDTNEESKIPIDYNQAVAVFKSEKTKQGESALYKLVFHKTPTLDKIFGDAA